MNCACCQSSMVLLPNVRGFSHLKCDKCGFESFSGSGSDVSAELYEDDQDYQGDLEIAGRYQDLLQWHHRVCLDFLKVTFSDRMSVKVLDIGCFNGFFVRALRNSGFEAEGLDFNQRAIEFGGNVYNLEAPILQNKAPRELVMEERQFQAVTLFEVIEHVPDVSSLMADAIRLLEPGGLLVLSTPNSRMCWRPDLDYPPHHLSRFTPQSLDSLLRQELDLEVILHEEQFSSLDLLRHYFGSFLRGGGSTSLRGGELRGGSITIRMRKFVNRSKNIMYAMLYPFDKLLFKMGCRYIGQVIIARKKIVD